MTVEAPIAIDEVKGAGRTLPAETDVAIVGSGFSGIAMAAKLRRAGREDFVVLERARDVGGTWRDNSYPGCACDVPSHVYSFSFAPNPRWSSTFSPQGEIHSYLREVAEREGVAPHIHFGCEVEDARWDADASRWRLRTASGEISARALIAAAGPFSEAKIPEVEGLDRFEGTVFHSASWDHDHDLSGERVAVIGTGASSIQFVPEIQPEVGELHLYQRTAPWIVPRRARPLTRIERAVYQRFPAAQRAMRLAIAAARETFAIPMIQVRLSGITKRLALTHLHSQVKDPELRRKLTPRYAPGCKRILISNDYYPSLAKDNVEVVTDGIAEIRERSIVDAEGVERDVDTIIFGTGFNVTEPAVAKRVRGADGRSLADRWAAEGMQAHRGTTVRGFPNLFFLLGPNTGLGHNSVMLMAEAQADYALRGLDALDSSGADSLEPAADAQEHWNEKVQRRGKGTVWLAGGCASWYLDAHGRNTTVWPDFTFRFRHALSRFDLSEYELAPAQAPAPAPAKVAA